MSGHSHSKTIKHQKELTDKKRGQIFSKMVRMISVAVKEAGPNSETNTKLKVAIEKAKEFNMPKENIERAIKQASGGAEGANFEEVVFEAYGPAGVAIIIEGVTDNKNRTLGEIKQILNQNGGKLTQEGAVRWMFERKGAITINCKSQIENQQNKEDLELKAIEAGAQDIYRYNDALDVYTTVEGLENVKKNLENQGIKIEGASLDWVPKEEIILGEKDKETAQKLFEALDENDDVQEIYSNLKV
jgi:YebC/PmpR family DNA-binding regulatory protein